MSYPQVRASSQQELWLRVGLSATYQQVINRPGELVTEGPKAPVGAEVRAKRELVTEGWNVVEERLVAA